MSCDSRKPSRPKPKPTPPPVQVCPAGCPRCCAQVTSEQLKAIFTTATDERINAARDAFNDAFDRFEINTCLRKAHFFAQIRQEAGAALSSPAENMNYAATALPGIFKYFKKHPDEATLYGRTKDHVADQEAIGNRAYADRMGNGDVASGDGWKYRGKGYIQITGKDTYNDVQKEIDAKYPESGIDIIKTEDDVLTPKGAMLSAMGYWTLHNLNTSADGGDADANVDGITAIINKNTDSYAARRDNFDITKVQFKTAECTNRKTPE